MLSAMANVVTLEPETLLTDSAASSILPEHSGTELLIALAIFLFACVYLWPLRDFTSFNADEGITLCGADRILRGQVPYRDYFSFVTPGSQYLMAFWFKLFGTSFVVARSVLLVYAGIFGGMTYFLGRRLYSRSTALFSAALLVLGCMPFRLLAIHNWDSTLFAVLAIYCSQRALETPSSPWWFCVGFTAAATCLTEQSKGVGVLLGLGIAALLLLLPPRKRWPDSFAKLGWAAMGFMIPLTVTFAYFASQHAMKAMLAAWFWPLRHYSVVNRVTFGWVPISAHDLHDMFSSGTLWQRALIAFFSAPMILISTLALLVIATTVYSIVTRCNAAPSRALDVRVVGGSVFFGTFLATLATGRADTHHLLYLMPLCMYLVPSILDVKHPSMRSVYRMRSLVAGLLLFSFTGFGLVTLLNALSHPTRTETRRGTVRFGYPDEVLRYVRSNVAEGQPLYIHPYQPFYTFMTGTINPTHFEFLFPGMNTRAQSESVIQDLAADRTPVVLLDPRFAADKVPDTWPSVSLAALAVDPVEDYILRHYRTCRFLNLNPQQLWSFYYMVRNDMQCPVSAGRATW